MESKPVDKEAILEEWGKARTMLISHVSQWLYSEAKMIVDGHFMSQEEGS